jgi:hypothetical protein
MKLHEFAYHLEDQIPCLIKHKYKSSPYKEKDNQSLLFPSPCSLLNRDYHKLDLNLNINIIN